MPPMRPLSRDAEQRSCCNAFMIFGFCWAFRALARGFVIILCTPPTILLPLQVNDRRNVLSVSR